MSSAHTGVALNLASGQPASEHLERFAKVVRRRRQDVEQQDSLSGQSVNGDVRGVEEQNGRDLSVPAFAKYWWVHPAETGCAGGGHQESAEERHVPKLRRRHIDK